VINLGDPYAWPKQRIGETGVYLYVCPRCGAACLEPYPHKKWHEAEGR